ncbi:MAG TPA: MFS transporter [Opitutaceae bacterium]
MNLTASTPVPANPRHIPMRAWVLLGLVAMAAVLFMVDRQVLSLLKTTLRDELGLTDVQYGWLITAFMVPYTVMYLFTGGWIDRWGTRATSLVFIGAMSLATVLTGMARNFTDLFLCRVLLGAAEAGIIPASILFVVLWFPKERRATAVAIKSPIAVFGTVSAPPLVAWITLEFGWRTAFVIPGVVGLIVAAGWWMLDRNPPDYGDPKPAPAEPGAKRLNAFGLLLRNRRIWPLLAVRVISDPLWFFLLYWHAPFLQEQLGFSLAQIGKFVWILPLCGALGNLLTGLASDKLVARGLSLQRARTLPLVGATVLAPLAALLPFIHTAGVAITLLALLYILCNAWIFLSNVFVADLVPRENVATAVGLLSAMGGVTSALFNLGAGWMVTHAGYAPLFWIGALLHPIAAVVLWRAYGRNNPETTSLS